MEETAVLSTAVSTDSNSAQWWCHCWNAFGALYHLLVFTFIQFVVPKVFPPDVAGSSLRFFEAKEMSGTNLGVDAFGLLISEQGRRVAWRWYAAEVLHSSILSHCRYDPHPDV